MVVSKAQRVKLVFQLLAKIMEYGIPQTVLATALLTISTQERLVANVRTWIAQAMVSLSITLESMPVPAFALDPGPVLTATIVT